LRQRGHLKDGVQMENGLRDSPLLIIVGGICMILPEEFVSGTSFNLMIPNEVRESPIDGWDIPAHSLGDKVSNRPNVLTFRF
jgi:hypothetical protein